MTRRKHATTSERAVLRRQQRYDEAQRAKVEVRVRTAAAELLADTPRSYGDWLLRDANTGHYLQAVDVHWQLDYDNPCEPSGLVVLTPELALAQRFQTQDEALAQWREQSSTMPVRSDGQPNRPLTAYTMWVERAP